jgi:WD40 repeat protein
MKTSRSRLTFAGLIAGFLGVISMAGAAPAPLAPRGKPKLRLCFQADPKRIRSLEFTSDGKKLLSSGTEGAAKLWDVATGKQVATFTGSGKPKDRLGTITWPALSPDGKILATAELDSSIRLYDVATGKKLATLTQPENGPRAFLLFSRDGKTLLSLGLWDRHYLWNLETKKARVIMPALDGLKDEKRGNYMTVGTVDPKGQPLLLVREHPRSPNFELWTTDSVQHPAVTFPDPIPEDDNRFPSGAPTNCFTISPDCKTIASAHADSSVRLWDAATGKNTATFPKIPGSPHTLAFHPDGKVVAVGYQPPPPQPRDEETPYPPPCVGLYEVATGKMLATLKGDPGVSGPLVFSPDGRTLATTNEGPPPPRGARRRRDEARTDGGAKIMLWSLPARYAPPK